MNNFKPLAPADETLIQYLKMGSDLVNRKKNSHLEMTSKPTSGQNLLLDDTFAISRITLRAKNYINLSGFYKSVLGLEVLENNTHNKMVLLGRNKKSLIEIKDGQILSENDDYTPGLFHFALKFESEAALASTLIRINYYHPELYRGGTYNGVSTNFYFEDPEGNGIKIYHDKSPNGWKWLGNTIQVNPQPIDQTDYLTYQFNEKIDETWDKQPISIGHIHLQVGNISKAKEFYNGLFGLNTTFDLPSVNFFSSNEYHCHIAINAWNSRGNTPSISQGLEEIQISITDDTYLSALKRKLEDLSFKFSTDKKGRLIIIDPSTLIKFEIKLLEPPRIIETPFDL